MHKFSFFIFIYICFPQVGFCQQIYFPPNNSEVWQTISPETLGYCPERIDSLYNMLEKENTKAFLLLKDGKIVLEKYFDSFTKDSSWYWASAGKSLTAFLVGLAQEDGHLNISDPTSDYLGTGWTSATEMQESAITVWNQLSMTSGLNDMTGERDCTNPECLKYLVSPSTRWAYHNAPYTLLDEVVESATGQNLNIFSAFRLRNTMGMTGLFFKLGFNNVFFSRPRSMARFGLLMLNKGNWNGTQIMKDTSYFNQMIRPSQTLNNSYGLLWWLNGQSSFMVPQLQFVFQGSLSPNAPADMYSAMGKNGQILNVVPSQNMVVVRMGDAPGTDLVPFMVNDRIWNYINQLQCVSSTGDMNTHQISVSPNPASDYIRIKGIPANTSVIIWNASGQQVLQQIFSESIYIGQLPSGHYRVGYYQNGNFVSIPLVKI